MKTWILHLLEHGSVVPHAGPLQPPHDQPVPDAMEFSTSKWHQCRAPLSVLLLAVCSIALADDFASLRADRAAIERVYYSHRLGEKPPFEQTLPSATLEKLVRQDLRKEALLQQSYGVEVTPAMLDAEVQRINTTTRGPDVLAELKAALGNDPARFARTVAKPILVERLLREKFDNDDTLHARQRRTVEVVREQLLAETVAASRQSAAITASTNGDASVKESAALCRDVAASKLLVERRLTLLKRSHSNEVSAITWQLGARPAETNAPGAEDVEVRNQFGPNAQLFSPPPCLDKAGTLYFDDLPADLQRVLRAQLRQPGDVSAVIESPGGFLLYVCKTRAAETLGVATLSLPKRSYEEWLQPQSNP